MKTTPLNSLAQAIMLGTGAGSSIPVLEAIEKQFADIESRLLASATVAGLVELGGCAPIRIEVQEPVSGQESQLPLPDKAVPLLKRMLSGEFAEVLGEFLQITAEKGFIMPPETLPALLGLGKNRLRKQVSAVMGERGRWLADHNPAWSEHYTQINPEGWDTGTFDARLALLEELRKINSGKALQLVQSTWEGDPPEQRAAFLRALAPSLSRADESFLEGRLDDKHKEVRQAALDCLTRLPDSRLVARHIGRLEVLLQIKSRFLGGDTLEATLPEELDSMSKRDGVGGAVLRKGLGEKANWLAQLLSFVPPSHWSQKWNRTPDKLIQAASGSEWKEAILLGWTLAAARCADPEWAAALVSAAVKQKEIHQSLAESGWPALSRFLPVEKVEALARSTIFPGVSDLQDTHPILELLEAYPYPWSLKLARTVIGSLKRQDVTSTRWRLAQDLPKFGLRMPPEFTEDLTSGWPKRPGWDPWINKFTAVMRFRKEIMEAL